MTLSRHPGSVPVLAVVSPVSPTYRPSFCPMRRPTLADDHSELGPCSLASAVLFGDACDERIRDPKTANRFLQLHYDVRAPSWALCSRWDEGL